jgi:hypothetical protein
MSRFSLGSGNSARGVLFGWRGVRFSAVGMFALMILATPVWAQSYRQIKPRISERDARELRGILDRGIRNPAGFGADADKVKEYFSKWYFPKMTLTDPDSLTELGELREDLFSRFIRAARHEPSRTMLTGQTLTVASSISKGNYHPSVRFNAALILGNLDQRIGNTRSKTPPIPLPAATAVMLELLEQEDIKGIKVHPSVRYGALLGLERHARFGVDSKYAERVTKAALDVIAEETSSEEVTQDVRHWMKCRAASVLVNQHWQKPNAELQTALNTLMTSEDIDLESRCFVAGLMESLDYGKAEAVEPKAVLAALGSLSKDVMKAEAELAEKYRKDFIGEDVGFRQPGLFPGGPSASNKAQPKIERRQLLGRLKSIYDGGTSLAEGVPDDTKSQVQGLLEAMKPARDAARNKDSAPLAIAEVVIRASRDVDRVVNSWDQLAAPVAAPAAAPVEPEESDEPDFS